MVMLKSNLSFVPTLSLLNELVQRALDPDILFRGGNTHLSVVCAREREQKTITLDALHMFHDFVASIEGESPWTITTTTIDNTCLFTSSVAEIDGSRVEMQVGLPCSECITTFEHCDRIVLRKCPGCDELCRECEAHASYCEVCDYHLCVDCLLEDAFGEFMCSDCGFECSECQMVFKMSESQMFCCEGRDSKPCQYTDGPLCTDCLNVGDALLRRCHLCRKEFCNECRDMEGCEKCYKDFCSDCQPLKWCHQCDRTFCDECQYVTCCEVCNMEICEHCQDMTCCDECGKDMCPNCLLYKSCEDCNQTFCEGCRLVGMCDLGCGHMACDVCDPNLSVLNCCTECVREMRTRRRTAFR